MPNDMSEGTLVKSSKVVFEKRQLSIRIPQYLREIFGVKKGEKFNWYVKRDDKTGKISLRAVYIKYPPAQKYFNQKKEKKK